MLTVLVTLVLFQVTLDWRPLVAVVSFTVATNAMLTGWLRVQQRAYFRGKGGTRGSLLLVMVITIDLLSLTVLLYFTGGSTNPFMLFYLVNVALGATILPAGWGWTVGGIAATCAVVLFFGYHPIPELEAADVAGDGDRLWGLSLSQAGLLVALLACAIVLIYFVTRISRELQQLEERLRWAEQQTAKSQRLEALGTLAAGAGHELATPLSTIAVVTKELSRELDRSDVPALVAQDVHLIQKEVTRCREILDRMRGSVTESVNDPLTLTTAEELLTSVQAGLMRRPEVRFRNDKVKRLQLSIPRIDLSQAIRGVVQNALQASPDDRQVAVEVSEATGCLVIVVKDRGPGMSEEVLQRAGHPFFTTKEPGEGMGLGLFLARSVVERLGGTIEFQSPDEGGLHVVIRLPLPQ